MATSLSKLFALVQNESFRRTSGYYLLFICLGLNTAVIGPTLPALADQTQTRLGDLGLLFLAGSAGYTLGTTLGGQIFDRIRGQPVLGIAQLAAAALIALIPLTPWFWLLLVWVVGKGVAEGVINTGANTLLLWTHRDKAGPYMNGLHFFFGLGAFLAPFLIAQVLGLVEGYRWAYWVLAAFAAVVGLRLLMLSGSPPPIPHVSRGMGEGASNRIYYPMAVAAALFLFFYVGAEITFGGWIYTYAVLLKLAGPAEAAYLTSGFWLSFTLGRLLSIPLATRFRPPQIILAASLSCLFILALAILLPSSGGVLWVVAAGLGFCLAPLWPAGYTLAGQSLPLTARLSSLVLLGDSFGGMVLPWLAGQVIEASGPPAMIYLVFGSLLGNGLAFAGMVRLPSPK